MSLKQIGRRNALALLLVSFGLGCIAPRQGFALTDSERLARKAFERAYRKLREPVLPQIGGYSFGELVGCRHDRTESHGIPVRIPPDAFSIGSDYRSNCGLDLGHRADYGRHRGIDMAAPRGTPVLACAGGTIQVSQRKKIPGDEIWIEHGGLRTRYIHLGKRLVRVGQEVKRGEVIGSVGASGTGSAGIDHLHLEVFRSFKADCCTRINPHLQWYEGPGRITLFDPLAPDRFAAKPMGLTFPLPAKGDVDRFLRELAVLTVQWYR